MAYLYGDVHIDAALSGFAIGYHQERTVFIADQVCPPVNVNNASDYYWVGGKESFNVPNVKRAPTAKFPRIELSLSTARYSCDGYGVEVPVSREEQANADVGINPEQEAVMLAVDTLMLNYEKRVATMLTDTSQMTQYAALTANDMFDNNASDPISTIMTAKDNIISNLGVQPNLVIMGRKVWQKLRQHAQMIERTQYVKMGTMLTTDLAAQFFDVDTVLVGNAIYNSANEGVAVSPVMGDVWGKVCIVMYLDPANIGNRRSVTPVRSFCWINNGSGGRFAVSTYFEPQRNSTVIQCTDYTCEKVIEPLCAYLLTNVVT